jgi:hypothetical protein
MIAASEIGCFRSHVPATSRSGNIENMRIPMALLALLLCALPLLAENGQRRVVAPCELTTASVIPSGKKSETQGSEFAIRVNNNSTRTIAFPRSPIFGWRVETQHKKDWQFKAEGGPIRRVNAKDEHLVVLGNTENAPLIEITPTGSREFYMFLPEADEALHSEKQIATFKLNLYWAAPAELAKSNPAVPPCAVAAEWVVGVQTFPPPRK